MDFSVIRRSGFIHFCGYLDAACGSPGAGAAEAFVAAKNGQLAPLVAAVRQAEWDVSLDPENDDAKDRLVGTGTERLFSN